MKRLTPKQRVPDYIWHKPHLTVKGGASWHNYNRASGESACHRFQLVGIGFPTDARRKTPTSNLCAACAKNAVRRLPK